MKDFTALLHRYDDPVYWEYPPGFDHKAAICRLAKFTEALALTLVFR